MIYGIGLRVRDEGLGVRGQGFTGLRIHGFTSKRCRGEGAGVGFKDKRARV